MPPETTVVRREGREAPPLAIPLRAGPLRVVFDRGELRWIRLGEREVLRGIYAAVREAGWATVPARLEDLVVEAEPDSFRIRFTARHARGDVRFDWEARVEGSADGRISYAIDGVAGSRFLRNRIGFCVLHPASECAGAPCTLETVDGRRQAGTFPRLVSPQQPFLGLRAIAHEPVASVVAEVRMEGDTFETEDQRNWSDASFKTYCTPLEQPFPVEVQPGARVRQSVTLRLSGPTRELMREAAEHVPGATPKKHDSPEPVVVQADAGPLAPLPALGLGGGGLARLGAEDAARIRALRLDHLRADLHLEADGWQEDLARAAANAALVDLPLELALVLPDDPAPALDAFGRHAAALSPRVARFLLFRAADHATHDGDAALARERLSALAPGAGFGGGSSRHFAELNRRRPAPASLDRIVFALNPQVHAFDDATLFENAASLPWLAETAAGFAAGLPIAVSPLTLRPRQDPRPASSRAPGEAPFTDDPRQSTVVAAAWTLAVLASAAPAGFASLTFFEPTGPRGLMDGGVAFPVFHAFADVAALPGAAVAPARSRRPERVRALALRAGARTRLFLLSVSDEPHPIRVEGLTGSVRCAPLGSTGAGEECGSEVELAPRAVLRVDVTAG